MACRVTDGVDDSILVGGSQGTGTPKADAEAEEILNDGAALVKGIAVKGAGA